MCQVEIEIRSVIFTPKWWEILRRPTCFPRFCGPPAATRRRTSPPGMTSARGGLPGNGTPYPPQPGTPPRCHGNRRVGGGGREPWRRGRFRTPWQRGPGCSRPTWSWPRWCSCGPSAVCRGSSRMVPPKWTRSLPPATRSPCISRPRHRPPRTKQLWWPTTCTF